VLGLGKSSTHPNEYTSGFSWHAAWHLAVLPSPRHEGNVEQAPKEGTSMSLPIEQPSSDELAREVDRRRTFAIISHPDAVKHAD
jgi:hypothetical protein